MQRTHTSLFQAVAQNNASPLLGAAITIPSVFVAQILGQTLCDFVFVDMEHSPMSAETMTSLVHAITSSSRGAVLPVVRLPSQGVEWIKWGLDSGAAGIIIPMVNTKDEAEQIVSRAVFPPKGKRSFGPARAPWGLPDGAQGGVPTYFQRALDGDVAILPMIESLEGLRNVDEILSVQGVSGVFIGPMDLRLALGMSGIDGTESAYTDAVEAIFAAAKKEHKLVGSLGMGSHMTRRFTQLGADFLVVSADAAVLSAGISSGIGKAAKSTASSTGASL